MGYNSTNTPLTLTHTPILTLTLSHTPTLTRTNTHTHTGIPSSAVGSLPLHSIQVRQLGCILHHSGKGCSLLGCVFSSHALQQGKVTGTGGVCKYVGGGCESGEGGDGWECMGGGWEGVRVCGE